MVERYFGPLLSAGKTGLEDCRRHLAPTNVPTNVPTMPFDFVDFDVKTSEKPGSSACANRSCKCFSRKELPRDIQLSRHVFRMHPPP